MRIRFIDVDGVRTRYAVEGEDRGGRPLVLLHGGFGHADGWSQVMDELATERPVFAPDMVGHGFTDPVDLNGGAPHGPTISHLLRWVELMKWEEFDVGGSSFGALIAAQLYFHRMAAVKHLILIGSGAAFNPDETFAPIVQDVTESIALLEDPTPDSLRGKPLFTTDELLSLHLTMYSLPDSHKYRMAAAAGMSNLAAWRPYRILDRLEDIHIPTLAIWGRQDPTPWEMAAEAVKRIPNAELTIIEDCGHNPFAEQAEQFTDAVRSFLPNATA